MSEHLVSVVRKTLLVLPIRVETERHVEGLFARQEWLSLLAEVGFQAEAVAIEHSEFESGQYVAFVGVRPK